MNKIIERWNAETPDFFKKLKKYAFSIGGSAAAVLTANNLFGLSLDATLISTLGYVVAACVAIAGTAKLTKAD
jgi:hypothetical protein